jgi:hypothetical protein
VKPISAASAKAARALWREKLKAKIPSMEEEDDAGWGDEECGQRRAEVKRGNQQGKRKKQKGKKQIGDGGVRRQVGAEQVDVSLRRGDRKRPRISYSELAGEEEVQ